MLKLVGNTFQHKTLLKQSGFRWNATGKSWDGDLSAALDFQQAAIRELLESGDLRATSEMELRNGPDRFEIDNQLR